MASLNALSAEGEAQSVGGVGLEAEEHMDGFIVTDEFPSTVGEFVTPSTTRGGTISS